MEQEQFLEVIDRDEAERRFHAVLDLRPLDAEEVSLPQALYRVLARDVIAPIDVPSFDRADVDGFAVRAEDTFGASEELPRRLRLNPEVVTTGIIPDQPIGPGTATPLATGSVVPRGANAVVMVEFTDVEEDAPEQKKPVPSDGEDTVLIEEIRSRVLARATHPALRGTLIVRRPVTPGGNITFAGTDIGRGETVLRRGESLTSRETGVLAALGLAKVAVIRRPLVAILSTGNEIIPPGAKMQPGLVYDSNGTVLADAVRELGGEPVPFDIVPDDETALAQELHRALACDVVLLSGGTSKGVGDLSYRVVRKLGTPGVVAHGVALKPGKPLCLAAVRQPWPSGDRKTRVIPVVILPGFPTSAIFTFREFVAPVIRHLGGRKADPAAVVPAKLPFRVNSERGRTEYLLVNLVSETGAPEGSPLVQGCDVAYPMGKGSGSVTTFSRADGFIVIPRQREYLDAGETVEVHLLSQGLRPADLVVIGSHCVGLDYLLGRMQESGFGTKVLTVGSMGGLTAARRGECDVAGIHLLDPRTNTYNRPYLSEELLLVPGYGRLQGIVFRPGDVRFVERSISAAVAQALADPGCVLINRNQGSGTRLLIDRLLGKARPAGHLTEARSHNAVVAAVEQGRADWGVAIENVARAAGLGFIPLQPEQYDFVIPRSRLARPALQAFTKLLEEPQTKRALGELGFQVP